MKRKWYITVSFGLMLILGSLLISADQNISADKKANRGDILTILHFNDSHSYWYSHDRRRWGGFARMATKIKELKETITNPVLVMVAGDMIEGRFYSRCEGGACDLKILDAMGVDYIVVGNHDWLIGPYNQYFVFSKARPRLRILSCNLEYTHYDSQADKYFDLPPEFKLSDYIKPYDVFSIPGHRVGLLGVSTYDYIYDIYYRPVVLRDPNYAVSESVDTLLASQSQGGEGCDTVVLLSHLGYSKDQDLFGFAVPYCPGDGVSVVVGAHSHTKVFPETHESPCSLGTYKYDAEIVQAWCHGKLLGQIDIDLTDKSNPIHNYVLHQIDYRIPADPTVKALIDDYAQSLMADQNISDSDNVLLTNVDMDRGDTETKLADLICDAYLWKLNQTGHPTQFTMFNTNFIGDHLERSTFLPPPQDDYTYFSSIDLNNVIPHTYDPSRKVSWLLQRYTLYGWELKLLLGTAMSYAYTNTSSNVSIVYDPSKMKPGTKSDKGITSFKLNGVEIDSWTQYTFAVDEGLKAALDQLSAKPIEYTDIEAWKAFRDYLRDVVKRIDRGVNSDIDGRVRTKQPDVAVFESYITYSPSHPRVGEMVTITTKIKNWGNQTASSGTVSFYYDNTPDNFVDDPSWQQIGSSQSFTNLGTAPATSITRQIQWDTSGLAPGLYPVYVNISGVPSEQNSENNIAQAFIELQ